MVHHFTFSHVMQHCTVGMKRRSLSNGSHGFKKSYFFSFFSFFSFASPPAALPSFAFSRAFSFSFSALAAACKNKESARNIFDGNPKNGCMNIRCGIAFHREDKSVREKCASRLTAAAGSMDAFAAFLAAFCSGVSEAAEIESAREHALQGKGTARQDK